MGKRDNRYQTGLHLLRAIKWAELGRHHEAHSYAQRARQHAEAHRQDLSSREQHSEIEHFDSTVNPLFVHLERLLSSIPKGLKKSLKPSLQVQNEKDFQTVVQYPGRDPRYDYKAFHEMNTEEQTAALNAFRHSKDPVADYHYAFDQVTGQLVHGQRWLRPSEAKNRQGKPKVMPNKNPLPQHMPGATVTISSPGHTFHGHSAEVQRPNPQMPGKIRVKVKNRQTNRVEDAYVLPHEVGLTSPDVKKNEEGIVAKSKAALEILKAKKGG